ncbi:Tryptophan synthase alpha chain [hydrothermal vent metagenome]|uniref:tryptophan synthase n=1 Tax=hydrothermal vent metagenome TaxID=652676 RepID=A0A3B1BS13_9ZZZZ
MSRIDEKLKSLKADKRKALVIFLTAGDPSLSASLDLALCAFDAGADIVELGAPFSDPLADGPVIQKSFLRSIGKGTNLKKTLSLAEKIRKINENPLVIMLGSTLVINHGTGRFMRDCASSGVDGLIIPDAPLEEAGEFTGKAKKAGLNMIMLAAPTSTPSRLRKICSMSRGFVYYINVSGVTGGTPGASGALATHTNKIVKPIARLKKLTSLPVLAGFGVKTPAQARALCKTADGVIIGSKAIEIIHSEKSKASAVKALAKFVRSVRRKMDRG